LIFIILATFLMIGAFVFLDLFESKAIKTKIDEFRED